MIILPPFYGNTILMICAMTQHAGLADNVKDHRKSTRTVILNPFFSFLYSNMEYHIDGALHQFEKQFAKFIGSKYALMVNSGSSANLLAFFCLINPKAKLKLLEASIPILPF